MHYTGEMLDFIKCLVCRTETHKQLTFRNISLPVRCADSNLGIYGSVVSWF